MKYDTILFDADETLFDFQRTEREALKNTILEFRIDYRESYHLAVYQEINDAIWEELEYGRITLEKLKTERFERLANRLNAKFDAVEFAKAYSRHLSDTSFLFEGSADLIKSLYGHYRLAIITNGLKEVQNKRIRGSEIGKYFDEIVISEEVGVSKPNPQIFEIAFQHMKQADKTRALMVGDSLSSDIRGGINFGIDTCWLNKNKAKNSTGLIPSYEIAGLPELKQILTQK